MEISGIGSSALTEQAKLVYDAACLKMAQHSENVAQYLILDTVEISNEAMQKYLAEQAK